jgi:outer membrane beta-barrel protein
MRPEFGVQFNAIMNRSFVYSFLGNATAAFHINEQLGVFGEGGVGITRNKGDCSTLGEKFRIEPYVDELRNWFGGGITYTPVYGKYQQSSGELIYFDWFFNASGGVASMAKRAGTCIPESPEASQEATVPQVALSTGQRYFLNKNTAATWSIKYMLVQDPLGGSIVNGVDNVLISIGASYFL